MLRISPNNAPSFSFFQEIQTERLFKREPEYEALESRRLSDPVLLEKYERLQKKWNDTCRRLEDYQKRFDVGLLRISRESIAPSMRKSDLLKTCCKLLRKLASSMRVKCLDNQLASSLLTTWRRRVVVKLLAYQFDDCHVTSLR